MNDAHEFIQIASDLIARNNQRISAIGARSIVLTKFLDAVLPYLTASQSVLVSQSFRQGIDDVLPLMDDVPFPPEHLVAMLELTNGILAALKAK